LLEEDVGSSNAPLPGTVFEQCYHTLQEIQAVLDKYKNLGTRSQRTWNRMQYGIEEAETLKQKLMAYLPVLTSFNAELRE
jgi:hypothetical protein